MASASGTPARSGVLVLLKPPGMTSHDAVAWLRRLSGQRRIGHAGTLDPGAAGVLPLCLGPATRLAEYLIESDKAYRAEVVFGTATNTGDAFGQTVSASPARHLTAAGLDALMRSFLGVITQIPPQVSAVKVGGERLYRLAHAGIEVERPSRRVFIHDLNLVVFRPGSDREAPVAIIDVACSKGTYIRTLAEDLALAAGTVAHLGFLLRTRSAGFRIEQALTVEEVEDRGWESCLLPPSQALSRIPVVRITGTQAGNVRRGGLLSGIEPPGDEGLYRLETPEGDLVALAERHGDGRWRTKKVFPRGNHDS